MFSKNRFTIPSALTLLGYDNGLICHPTVTNESAIKIGYIPLSSVLFPGLRGGANLLTPPPTPSQKPHPVATTEINAITRILI